MKSTLLLLKSGGGFRPWVFTFTLLLVASGAHAATMRVSSGSGKQGETVRICVSLESQGQSVAGTQNDLSWDGNCATLVEGDCQIATPRKQLNAAFPTTFSMRAFVLALDNVDPIPDGDLYCCNFTSELTAPGSCPVGIKGALAAGPDGKAISVNAVGGAIQFPGSDSGRAGGGTGATGGVAGGGGVVGGLVGQPGAGGAPQVFQGGGPGAPPTPIVIEPAGQEPPAEEPEEEEEIALNETPAATASAGATTAPTEAPTAAPTKVAGTPTSKPTARPTSPPTAAPTPAKKDGDGGWFSCQVTTGGNSATPHAVIAVLGLLALRLRRRRRR